MGPLELVKLDRLIQLSTGRPEVVIGLIDGPVAVEHPDLANARIREVPGTESATCSLQRTIHHADTLCLTDVLIGRPRP
jgi:hypothetical protein